MFYLDPLYLILALPGLLLGLWAQMRVKGTFKKYSQVRTTRNPVSYTHLTLPTNREV